MQLNFCRRNIFFAWLSQFPNPSSCITLNRYGCFFKITKLRKYTLITQKTK
jgi:hypothetical protein